MTDTRPAARRGPIALFAIYLVLLVWVVVWKLEVPYIGAAALLPRPVKLVPFVASGDAGPSAPLEVLANLALFVPFGLHLGLLAPSWRNGRAVAVFAAASLVLEVAQHLLSVGSFDITDVIVNTVGGVVGLGLVALARRALGTRTAVVLTRISTIGTLLALIAIVVFLASPLRVSQPHDVVVSPRGATVRG